MATFSKMVSVETVSLKVMKASSQRVYFLNGSHTRIQRARGVLLFRSLRGNLDILKSHHLPRENVIFFLR